MKGDWNNIIQPAPKPDDALRLLGRWTNFVGLGGWDVVSFDPEKKEARFRAKSTSWEVMY